METVEKPAGGRPPHAPSKKSRQTVERMRACGESKDTISRALGIDRNTLDKHYVDELLNGHSRQRMKVIDLMFKGAEKGNATLTQRLDEKTRAAGALAEFDRHPEPRAPKMGKKEIVHNEALSAGATSEWGDDLNPPPGAMKN